jgi:hypothetical protein
MGQRLLGKVGMVSMMQHLITRDFSVYRIKHVPTGLYFIPSRKVKVTQGVDWTYVKSNLSKSGKVYAKKPSLKFLDDLYYSHIGLVWKQQGIWNRAEEQLLPVVQSEWVIERI